MGDENNDQSQGHPAWQTILDKLPDSLHGIIKPELEAWDRGVQQKLQDVRSQYDPYKDFVENKVDPEFLQGAMMLAQNFQQDPNAVIEQAVEAFGLDWAQKQQLQQQMQQQQQVPDYYQQDQYDQYGQQVQPQQQVPDISNHPAFKQVAEQLQQLQSTQQQYTQQQQEEQQRQEFEQYLGELQQTHGEFDRDYVTALVANGVDGNEAVKRYQNLFAQNYQPNGQQQQGNQQQQPPVVMGGSGTSGSGIPQQPVNFGSMKDRDVKDLVIQMIQATNQDNNVSGG